MNKVAILVFVLISVYSHAQISHMRFLNEEIWGDVATFGKKIETKGYVRETNFDGYGYYGTFAGKKGMLILSHENNTIFGCTFVIEINVIESFREFVNMYRLKYKDAIEEQYGYYHMSFKTENGDIDLNITDDGILLISYSDRLGFENKLQYNIDDL